MAKPNTMFTAAASMAAPNDNLYEASARGLVITSTKRAKSMPAALSTRADRGSNTMAHRKKVVKPSVIPKPGITLGSRLPAFLISGRDDAGCRPWRVLAGAAFERPVQWTIHDEHRPARLGRQQRVIRGPCLRDIADAKHQHLRSA